MQPGERFERYEIEGILGRGGMGCVYRAHDPKLGRDVAVKVLLPAGEGPPSEEARSRILREARAAAQLSHPNAVSIFDVGESETAGPYIVMELVQGRSLREAVRDASVPLADKLRWLSETASALAAAHDRGIVHRDVKPENVLIRDDGAAKVLDFGIARRSNAAPADPSAPTEAPLPTLTVDGAQLGTPIYMAPEQIKGDAVDGRTDQFAWGVVAYEALGGKLPWRLDRGALGVAASILTDTPAPLEGVPPEVEAVVRRALAKDPAERFASMRELLAELGVASSGRGPEAREGGRASAVPETPRVSAPPPTKPSAEPPPARASVEAPGPRYDTQQFKEIFQRALERQESEGKYGRDDLASAAREMGIRDDVLADTLAEDDAARRREAEVASAEVQNRGAAVRKLLRSAVTFAIVNAVCYLALHLHTPWVLYGTLIALAFQARNVLFPKEGHGESRRERRRRRREERRKERAERLPPSRIAAEEAEIEEGVRALLSTTQKRNDRVRVATSDAAAERSHEAEAEAVAEEADERARARRR
jgi:serine/threonine-protein kinase